MNYFNLLPAELILYIFNFLDKISYTIAYHLLSDILCLLIFRHAQELAGRKYILDMFLSMAELQDRMLRLCSSQLLQLSFYWSQCLNFLCLISFAM